MYAPPTKHLWTLITALRWKKDWSDPALPEQSDFEEGFTLELFLPALVIASNPKGLDTQ